MERIVTERTLIDLFSGAGGLSCGLEKAGFTPLLANELEPTFAQTYKANNPEVEVVEGDIREVSEHRLKRSLGLKVGELDLLAGGPPCQGFSVNAPIRSLDDQRNHLFRDFLRIAKTLKPKAIIIENVPGIVSLGKGTVIEQIYKELTSLGYSVGHRILFAGHYGVPQSRFRTIIVALSGRKLVPAFPEPKYRASSVVNFAGGRELCMNVPPLFASRLKEMTTVWDAISDLPEIDQDQAYSPAQYPNPAQSAYQKLLRRGSRKLHNHECARLGEVNKKRLKHIPQGGSWRDIPFDLLPKGLKRARRSDHTKRYGRLDPNGMSSTILTKCDPHWGSFFHPVQDRVISVREAARIQSFPDVHKFGGSLTQQYAQVGNAVPPLMAMAIGESVMGSLKGDGAQMKA